MQCPECGSEHGSWLNLARHTIQRHVGVAAFLKHARTVAPDGLPTSWACPWCGKSIGNNEHWNSVCDSHVESCTQRKLAEVAGKLNTRYLRSENDT